MMLPFLVVLGLSVVACGLPLGETAPEVSHGLWIVGDVEVATQIDSLDPRDWSVERLERGDRTITVIPLAELLEMSAPLATEYRVAFAGRDGRLAVVGGGHLADSRLGWSEEYGWEVVNPNHPVSGNIKDLEEIVVLAEDPGPRHSLNVIRLGENIDRYTVGELAVGEYTVGAEPIGSASREVDGVNLEAKIYQRERWIDLDRFVRNRDYEELVVVGEAGEVAVHAPGGKMMLERTSLAYRAADGVEISRVKGIVLDPPKRMNTAIFGDAKESLERGIPTMVVLVDGLGWDQYLHMIENGRMPFLGAAGEPDPALAIYPSITPVNVAASITGALPHESGVVARNTRIPEVPTLFQWARERGMEESAVIGPIAPIDLGTDPHFRTDENGDGSEDDEIFDTTLKLAGEGYDFLYVHFKGVDVAGHAHGAFAEETLSAIDRIDGYVRGLAHVWEGNMIVYSDHGMKTTPDGGEHGLFVHEDMFVPHWYLR